MTLMIERETRDIGNGGGKGAEIDKRKWRQAPLNPGAVGMRRS